MNPRRDPEPPTGGLDPTSALLDQVLAADVDQQHQLLEQLSARHPECATDLRDRFTALEALGLLDGETDTSGGGLAIPDQIGDFKLAERLGVGGMGVVFRAHQQSLGRDVALKLVRPDFAFFDTQRRRFRREAEAVARLDHPNIVPVFAIGESRGIPYLAMQYVQGTNLAQLLTTLQREPGGLDGRAFKNALLAVVPTADSAAITASVRGLDADWSTVTASVMLPIADALAHAHGRGIMHRDVKPSNIMIAASGRSLLVDFGLAALEGHAGSITRSGAFLGSLPYMSPEQIDGGRVDPRSDVFALGCVLYEMLTLRPAFESSSAEDTMSRIVWREPPDLRRASPNVSPDLAAVVAKCLEKAPERRYQTPSEVAGDLRAVLERRPVSAERLTPWIRLLRFSRREPVRAWSYAACVVALLVVTAVGGYLLAQQDEIVAGREKLLAERVERHLSLGYLALWRDNTDEAARYFSLVLADDSDRYEALCGLAQAREQDLPAAPPDVTPGVDLFIKATPLFANRRVNDINPEAVEILAEAVLATHVARSLFHGHLAMAAAHVKDEATARTAVRWLVYLWPDDVLSAVWAGYALLEFDAREAAQHLQAALDIEPDLAAAHALLGAARIRLGETKQALHHLLKAREIGGAYCELLINTGVALSQSGAFDQAVDTLREATELPNALPGAFYNLGVVLAQRDPDAALDAFERAVERAPDYADAWNNIGTLLLEGGDYARATRAFRRVTVLRPDDQSFRHLGAALARAGNAEGAATAYRRVVALAPTDAEAHAYLCTLFEHLRDEESLAAERARFAKLPAEDQQP